MSVMRVTARQLQVGDMLTATDLVVIGVPENLQRANSVVTLDCLTQRGGQVEQRYAPNAVVNVVRGYDDPTNNPYWWALEAQRERQQDEDVYRHEMEMEEDARYGF